MEIRLRPIGFVVEENVVEILPEFESALRGLSEHDLLWILYHFHKAEEALLVRPRWNGRIRGVLSTRSPNRPNRIGMIAVKLLKVEGRRIFVQGLDALKGSPVLDIKPYAEVFDLPFGSVLCMRDIRKRILHDKLIEDYIDLEVQLQPNGFDCTLRKVARVKGSARIDFHSKELPEVEEIPFDDEGWVFLPKGFYKAYLNEVLNLPTNLMAFGRPRSTLIRAGANILTAVWDAGYRGRSEVGLVVYNEDGIWLKKNARIVQLVFVKLSCEAKPYEGSYQLENI